MSSVLQSLRLKGRATAAELAVSLGSTTNEVEQELESLSSQHLVVERTTGRRPGWMLTGEGRERYDSSLAEARTPEVLERLGLPNTPSRYTVGATDDDGDRFEVIDELHAVQEKVAPSLQSAGEVVPRFGAYANRLAAALEKAAEDHRFVVSPTVDSYHTVWFECHEDYLLMLDRSRADEGSW